MARGSREYVQFRRIAPGSAAELQIQLAIARRDLGYCGEKTFAETMPSLAEVIRLLRSYIAKLAPQSNAVREDSPLYHLDDT